MTETFDPYHRWLGIPPGERPPNHYALLGLGLFEGDADAISNAADRQMAHVRTLQSGPKSAFSQQLLNELATARLCLLDAARKVRYDAELKAKQPPAASPVPPLVHVAEPKAQQTPTARPVPPIPIAVAVAPAPAFLPAPQAASFAVPESAISTSPVISSPSTPARTWKRGLPGWAGKVAGGFAAGFLVACVALSWVGGNRQAEKHAAEDLTVTSIFESIKPPSPLGVVAEKLVIWNTHSGPYNNVGTLECNVRLLAGGREIWSTLAVAVPWAPNEDRSVTLAVPHERFDRVRVEVTKWEREAGGLAEVQVLSADNRNLAFGCPAMASGTLHDRVGPEHITDGVTTAAEADVGAWLLPVQTAGWIEVDLSWPRPANLAGVTSDKLVIWNQHNGFANNCGTKWCDVTLLSGARIAWRQEHVELPWAPWQDLFVELKLPTVPFDRVRVDVTPREGQAAGLAEVQILHGAENLALGCPTIADGIHDKAMGDIRVTDGIVSSESHTIGYWVLSGPAPGWVEIDLACLDAKYGKACRRLGLARVIVDGDWQRALPWLARGDDRLLRQLARADLQDTNDTAEQLGLGDAWWDFAQQAEGHIRKRMLARSAWRYRQALSSLHEFRKIAVQARIDQVVPALPERDYLFFMPESELRLGAHPFRGIPSIVVNGVPSPYGLWLHPGSNDSSHVAFGLNKRYRGFRGAAAINDSARGQIATALTFRIVGDGQELWKSSPLKEAGLSEAFDLDIEGVDKLELFVDCPGGHHYAHSVWIEPRCER